MRNNYGLTPECDLTKKCRGVYWQEITKVWGEDVYLPLGRAVPPKQIFLNFQIEKSRVLCIFIARKTT